MTQSASTASPAPTPQAETRPDRASIVLLSLILVAAVANLNLSVANVALPDIGIAFDASTDGARPGGGRLLARARGICVVARRSASSGQTLHFPGFLGYSAWLDSGRLAGHLGSADPLSVVQKGA